MCVYVCSQTWNSVRLLDFSGGWDEALETGSAFLTNSLQSGKETLCTTRYQASIKVDWMAVDDVISPSDMRRSDRP